MTGVKSAIRQFSNGAMYVYVGQDEILRAVVNRAIQAPATLTKRVTNPLQVVNRVVNLPQPAPDPVARPERSR